MQTLNPSSVISDKKTTAVRQKVMRFGSEASIIRQISCPFAVSQILKDPSEKPAAAKSPSSEPAWNTRIAITPDVRYATPVGPSPSDLTCHMWQHLSKIEIVHRLGARRSLSFTTPYCPNIRTV
jgi:hypothetical protein